MRLDLDPSREATARRSISKSYAHLDVMGINHDRPIGRMDSFRGENLQQTLCLRNVPEKVILWPFDWNNTRLNKIGY